MWGDVVLRIRGTRELVPTHRHGVELDGFFVSAKCYSGADDGGPGKFAISGTSGAATHSIPAAGSQAALTAVLGRSYRNHHRQQSGRQRPRQGQPVALGFSDHRARSRDRVLRLRGALSRSKVLQVDDGRSGAGELPEH